MICARVYLTLDQRIVATSLYSIVGKTRDTRVTSLPQKPDHSNMIFVSMFCRQQQRRFLVIDEAQFILVEPDTTKLGWGVVKFVARLQVGELVCFCILSLSFINDCLSAHLQFRDCWVVLSFIDLY